MGERARELASLVQTRTQQTWDLLNKSLTGKESIIFLGCKNRKLVKIPIKLRKIYTQLLHKFLVLVEFLQGLSIHAR
jgi:hypothetical protein